MRIIGTMFLFLACFIFSKCEELNGQQLKRSSDAHTNTLLNIANNGLPTTSDPKHVIIIGAGIAGLTAGKLLKDAGHKITILEASDRVGGRILTYRDPANRYYVDLGARRIPYEHKFVKTFVDFFNLSTADYKGYDNNTWYYVNGKKLKSAEVDDNPDILGFNTSSTEKGKLADQILTEAVEPVLKECRKDGVFDNVCLTRYDRYSFKEYITEIGGLSKGAVDMLGVTWNIESNFYAAFTEIVRFVGGSKKYQIVGGADFLPKAFLPSLENHIIYNARVTRVEHGSDTVVVAHYPSSGRDVSISGDYLLTTATATSTSFIKFIPGLDLDKQNAIRNIHYDSATKIVLVFQRPFWKDEGISGGFSITDLPSKSIIYPSHDFESGLGVLIASFTSSDHSLKFLGLSDEECLNQALNDLAEIHGNYIRDLYLEGVVKQWSLDPYSLGAWTLLTPYQLKDLRIPIVRPQGRLLFAGEHTNFDHEWVDTAIKSAVEAANCISTNECYPNLSSGTKSHSAIFLPAYYAIILKFLYSFLRV